MTRIKQVSHRATREAIVLLTLQHSASVLFYSFYYYFELYFWWGDFTWQCIGVTSASALKNYSLWCSGESYGIHRMESMCKANKFLPALLSFCSPYRFVVFGSLPGAHRLRNRSCLRDHMERRGLNLGPSQGKCPTAVLFSF